MSVREESLNGRESRESKEPKGQIREVGIRGETPPERGRPQKGDGRVYRGDIGGSGNFKFERTLGGRGGEELKWGGAWRKNF